MLDSVSRRPERRRRTERQGCKACKHLRAASVPAAPAAPLPAAHYSPLGRPLARSKRPGASLARGAVTNARVQLVKRAKVATVLKNGPNVSIMWAENIYKGIQSAASRYRFSSRPRRRSFDSDKNT